MWHHTVATHWARICLALLLALEVSGVGGRVTEGALNAALDGIDYGPIVAQTGDVYWSAVDVIGRRLELAVEDPWTANLVDAGASAGVPVLFVLCCRTPVAPQDLGDSPVSISVEHEPFRDGTIRLRTRVAKPVSGSRFTGWTGNTAFLDRRVHGVWRTAWHLAADGSTPIEKWTGLSNLPEFSVPAEFAFSLDPPPPPGRYRVRMDVFDGSESNTDAGGTWAAAVVEVIA